MAGAAGGESGLGRSPQERRQRQLQLQQRLLRRSVGAAAEGAAPAAEQAPAPGTPQAACAAVATPSSNQQHNQQEQQHAGLQLTLPPLLSQHAEAPSGPQACVSDPRQQLLWSVAGRATSMSWQDELAAATAASTALAAAVAATATPTGAQSLAAAGGSAADSAAESQASGSAAEHEPAGSPQPLSARHRTSLDRSPWADLQPEMLAVVLAQAGHSSSLARTVSQVCTSWRRGLGEERTALQQLRFTRLELLPARDSNSSSSSSSSAGGPDAAASAQSCSDQIELPWLVQQAVKSNNVAATVAAARWLERRKMQRQGRGRRGGSGSSGPASATVAALAGTWYNSRVAAAAAVQAAAVGAAGEHGLDEAARYWRKAAKLGHPEGQWKLGWAHYKGLMGLSADGEEALLWLGRAARQLAEVVGDSAEGGSNSGSAGGGSNNSSSGGGSGSATGGEDGLGGSSAGRRQLPALMSGSECRHVLSQAAHVLGLLYLDGEGTKPDLGTALKWFRLAERQGCREVSRIIGSLLNVGMYG
ncbi:cobalamin biosynthesis [Chlorella sorokiniana]|uniref:Cobalamin biosynthesis n=1 Tax=Chlorella sorokiniana TaxID=3076 RepID=A0A2P6U2Q7_CHLSO|nr:cobalamin biosynthesis [Chlorella sorokiniana]|eukprot:PRW60596.1 cobalamin biosynthesis [Chlorella sorokiniana]